MIDTAADPDMVPEQLVNNLEAELRQLRLLVAKAIAAQKHIERRYTQAQSAADNWHHCAQVALQKGEENLAREALSWWHPYQQTAKLRKVQLEQQTLAVNQLRQQLLALERQIVEAKSQRNFYWCHFTLIWLLINF